MVLARCSTWDRPPSSFLVKKDSVNTIGMEFGTRIVHIADKSIKLQIWDTAGQVYMGGGYLGYLYINAWRDTDDGYLGTVSASATATKHKIRHLMDFFLQIINTKLFSRCSWGAGSIRYLQVGMMNRGRGGGRERRGIGRMNGRHV